MQSTLMMDRIGTEKPEALTKVTAIDIRKPWTALDFKQIKTTGTVKWSTWACFYRMKKCIHRKPPQENMLDVDVIMEMTKLMKKDWSIYI